MHMFRNVLLDHLLFTALQLNVLAIATIRQIIHLPTLRNGASSPFKLLLLGFGSLAQISG